MIQSTYRTTLHLATVSDRCLEAWTNPVVVVNSSPDTSHRSPHVPGHSAHDVAVNRMNEPRYVDCITGCRAGRVSWTLLRRSRDPYLSLSLSGQSIVSLCLVLVNVRMKSPSSLLLISTYVPTTLSTTEQPTKDRREPRFHYHHLRRHIHMHSWGFSAGDDLPPRRTDVLFKNCKKKSLCSYLAMVWMNEWMNEWMSEWIRVHVFI